jgi:hypothetical protein
MVRGIACALVLTVLSGCADRDAKDAVRASLTDPESARFSRITLSQDGSVACGLVNSKNRMGGYAGDTSFMVLDGQVWFAGQNESRDLAVASCCYSMVTKRDGRTMDAPELERFGDCKLLSPAIPES